MRAPRGVKNDLTGMRFGKLVVLQRHKDNKTNTRWLCKCDCGELTIAVSGNLKRNRHKTCGCGQFRPRSPRLRNQQGYVFVIDENHPRANPNSGRVREHIVVMEKTIGRELLPKEEVHHKNGIRSDNRPENLELWSKSHPAGARVVDLVVWAKEILKQYPEY